MAQPILKDFAFATVMDVYGVANGANKEQKITAIETALLAGEDPVKYEPADGEIPAIFGYDFVLDSLTISNITQEGPQKEARGGIHARPIIRHKKAIRLEMEDVVARIDTLEFLFGAKVTDNEFAITDKFPTGLALIGRTYVVDKATGERVWVQLKFEDFLPDGVFEMTMEAEGDLGMVNIAGELFPNDCGEYFAVKQIAGECADETVPDENPA